MQILKYLPTLRQGEGTFEFHVHGLAWPADTRDYNLDQHWNHICTTFRGGSTVQYTITVNGQMIENGTENLSHSGLEKGGVDDFNTYNVTTVQKLCETFPKEVIIGDNFEFLVVNIEHNLT